MTPKGKERYAALAKAKKNGIIKDKSSRKIISGHQTTPKTAEPYSVIDHLSNRGNIDVRTYYDQYGMKAKDIHTTDHGNRKHHNFGINGEHAHEYKWQDGRAVGREPRELTEKERKENKDIL